MSLRLEVREKLEKRFRKAAFEAYGYEKGALKKAAEEAFELWISMGKDNGIPEIENPLKLIEGRLSHLRGKYSSIQLQHEAKRLWSKK